MAEGFGLSIDVSFLQKLTEADKRIQEMTKKTNELSRVTVAAFQQMANSGVTPYIEQLNRQKKALEEIGKIQGTDAALVTMQKEAKKAVDEINMVIKALEKTRAYRGEQSGKTAISFANSVLGQRGETKSINNMQLAIRQLEEAQNRLNLNTKTGQKNYEKIGETIKKVQAELDKVKGKTKEVTQETEKTKKSFSGLGGTFSAVFSVSAITGFVNNLIKVRGEFEMQHRSLQVLLQDVDEANELWNKTVDLAVKSPFRVKDLVTYTKQLAAYRVESDKLYDTTRMLADVSAGLGVDMNRLILAFGQVKAANFLRGTELRQFSEAGVNMLEELAKRFTMLEGRAVSVGDVFERVSKRMVKFSDVEAVFQTITSEGGVFYQMQEKQSETLRGMIMNLKDSIDLMFNEMGRASDSPLKRAVQLVKELVDNWRKFIPVVSTAGAAFLAGFSVKIIASIGKAFTALWGIITANPIGAAISLIAALTVGIISARKNINELTSALSQVDKEITSQLEDSIGLYRKLAEQVRNVTATEKDRNKAMEQLKSRFEEILPDQLLELEYISDISSNYREATDAMMNYYNAKATEQKKDRVESQFAEELEGTDIPELINSIRSRISSRVDIDDRLKPILLSGVSGIVNEIVQDIKSGALSNDFDAISDEIQKRLEQYANVELPRTQAGEGIFRLHDVKDMIKTLDEYRVAIDNVMGLPFKTYAEREAADIFLPEKENIEATKSSFQEIINLVDTYSQKALSEWTGLDEEFNALISKLPEEAAAYIPLLSSMFENMKIAAAQGSFEFGKSIQGFQQDFLHGLSDALWSQTGSSMASFIQDESGQWTTDIQEELIQLVTNAGETLSKEAERLNLNEFQKSVVGAMEIIAQKTGQSVDEFREFIPKMGDSLTSTRENIESEIALIESRIKTWTNSLKEDEENLNVLRPGALGETQAEIDQATKLLEMFKMLRNFLGGADKGKKGRTDKTLEERIKVVDQMNKKYLELNKTLSKAESLEGAFKAYKDAFATAYGREDVRSMTAEQFAKNVLNFPDEDAIIKWLDDLAKTVSKKEDKFKVEMAVGKFTMDKRVRDEKAVAKQLKKDIQDMFDQYDLSLELKKLNIPSNLAKSLFDVDYLDLDGLKKAIEDRRVEFIGTDMEKEYEDFLEKIKDLSQKQREDEAKRWVKFLTKNLDQTKVVLEQKGIDISYAKLQFDAGKISAQSFAEVVREITKQANEDISKINFENLKDSSLYVKAMGDLAAYSKKELDKMTEALSKVLAENAKNMSVEELEAYHKALERIRKEQEKFDPFIRDNEIAKIQELIKLEKELANEEKNRKELEGDKVTLEQKRMSLLRLLEEAQSKGNTGQAQSTKNLQDQLLKTEGEIQQVDSLLANSEMNISNISGQIGNITGGAMGAIAIIDMIVQAVNDTCNAAKKTFEDIMSMADSFGVETDKGSWREASMFFEGMSNFNAEVTEGWENLKSGNIMGAIANTIGSIVGFIRDVNKWKDSNLEEALQDHLEEVERLQKEYEKLEWVIDRAFSFKKYGMVAEQTKNLGLQIDNLQSAIALEEDKKDTDPERIEELKENIEETSRQIQELYDNLRADIVGTFEDLSTTLGEAMISALQKGEDAIAAWGEEVDNIIQDIVGKLLIQKFLEPKIADLVDSYYAQIMPKSASAEKKYQEYLDAMESGDSKKADQFLEEYLKLNEQAINEVPKISEDATKKFQEGLNATGDWFLNIIPDWFKDTISSSQGSGLSALQKGIQGLSEQTAQVLEAYLNSVRMYVATISADTTSQLNEVKAIHRLLDSVTTTSDGMGGKGIKVYFGNKTL